MTIVSYIETEESPPPLFDLIASWNVRPDTFFGNPKNFFLSTASAAYLAAFRSEPIFFFRVISGIVRRLSLLTFNGMPFPLPLFSRPPPKKTPESLCSRTVD